jgi:polyhydroxybutyrate depolymerase
VLERETSLDERADVQHFFVVYPQGLRRAWNIGECCYYAFTHGVSEIAFMTAMLDQLRATVTIDTSRVYVTGYSDGGTLSYLLACALPDRIAAAAAISATLFDPLPSCSLPHPVPVMIVHGTGDHQIPYQGRPGGPASGRRPSLYHSVYDVTKFWLDRNRCYTMPEQVRTNRVIRVRYRCADSAEVLLYTILGGEHGWPGGGRGWIFSPQPPQDMVASDTVVRFFFRHHQPVGVVEHHPSTGVRTPGLPARSGQSLRRPPVRPAVLPGPQQPGSPPRGGAKTAS